MSNGWDAANYAQNFNFVPEYGRALIDILKPQAGEKILDLGCGTGVLTSEIAAKGAEVMGVDQDASMIELASKNYPALRFQQQNAEQLTLDQTFDAVFSNAALHWMNIGKVFPQVAKVLRTGGRFTAEMGGVHNIETIERAMEKAFTALGFGSAVFPWHFPAPSEAVQKLERAGFEVRYTHLFDRLTLLTTETGGVKGWVKMFGRALLNKLPEKMHEKFLEIVEEETRPKLFRDGQWYADYRRFHFVAVKI